MTTRTPSIRAQAAPWALAAAAILAPSDAASAQSLANPSFESAPEAELPSIFGVWGGDLTSLSEGAQAITPFDGSFMLRFESTSLSGAAGPGTGGNIWQLVDLSPALADVQGGGLFVWFRFKVNRIAGDAQTDTEFSAAIRAYDGTPDGFKVSPTEIAPALAETTVSLNSDDDTATWEALGIRLGLPIDTTYIAVNVSSVENIFNDSTGPEFDGHYADDASILLTACVGDLDGDGDTDVFDFSILASAFATSLGDPDFNPIADIDGDNAVNVFDFSMFAADFTCSD